MILGFFCLFCDHLPRKCATCSTILQRAQKLHLLQCYPFLAFFAFFSIFLLTSSLSSPDLAIQCPRHALQCLSSTPYLSPAPFVLRPTNSQKRTPLRNPPLALCQSQLSLNSRPPSNRKRIPLSELSMANSTGS